jgi:hypothetical protein
MKGLQFTVAILIMTALSSAMAEKKKALVDHASGQGYGMAGCGLGSFVFGDKPGMIQVFASTTNGFSGNQTFGISSGTLNCGESGKAAKAEQFIDVNKVALENDLARGQGESLTALSQVLECKNSNFAPAMKQNYNQSFPQGGANNQQLSAVAALSCQI